MRNIVRRERVIICKDYKAPYIACIWVDEHRWCHFSIYSSIKKLLLIVTICVDFFHLFLHSKDGQAIPPAFQGSLTMSLRIEGSQAPVRAL